MQYYVENEFVWEISQQSEQSPGWNIQSGQWNWTVRNGLYIIPASPVFVHFRLYYVWYRCYVEQCEICLKLIWPGPTAWTVPELLFMYLSWLRLGCYHLVWFCDLSSTFIESSVPVTCLVSTFHFNLFGHLLRNYKKIDLPNYHLQGTAEKLAHQVEIFTGCSS